MKAPPGTINVALDVKRLADSVRYKLENFGITTHTKVLSEELEQPGRCAVQLVAYADSRESSMHELDAAVDQVEDELKRPIMRGWQQRRSLPEGWRGLLRGLARVRGGRRLIQPLERKLDRLVYDRTRFAGEPQWDVYHSPVNPLPPRHWTGEAVRVLTVNDVLHLKFPEWSSDGVPAIRGALDSVDLARDWVVCISECSRRDMLSYLPIPEERTAVVYLAAGDIFDTPPRDAARGLLQYLDVRPERYVLALAQRDPRKNIPRLAQAFREATTETRLSDVVLLLICAAQHRGYYHKLLVVCGLAPSSFRIVTDVGTEELAGLYAHAGLFAYVSLYEGFGIPVVEAMKAGCPVVASGTSSIPEVAGDAALPVDPTNTTDIAQALRRALTDDALRTSLKGKGKRQAAQFSWDRTVASTRALYERMLASSGVRLSA